MYDDNNEESSRYEAQKKNLERQCAELDTVIHEFSQYIENTVDPAAFRDSLVLQ